MAPCARIKVHLLHAGDPHGLQHDVQFPTLRTWRIFKRHDQVMLVLPHGQLKCEYNMDQRFHAFYFLSRRCQPTGQVSHQHPESAGEARMNPCWLTHNHDSPKQTPPFGRQQIPTALSILIINQGANLETTTIYVQSESDGSKMAQADPQRAPRWPLACSKMVPRWKVMFFQTCSVSNDF